MERSGPHSPAAPPPLLNDDVAPPPAPGLRCATESQQTRARARAAARGRRRARWPALLHLRGIGRGAPGAGANAATMRIAAIPADLRPPNSLGGWERA